MLPAIRQAWHSHLYPSEAGARFCDPGWVDLVGWLYTKMICPMTHPSTNWARRGLIWNMWWTPPTTVPRQYCYTFPGSVCSVWTIDVTGGYSGQKRLIFLPVYWVVIDWRQSFLIHFHLMTASEQLFISCNMLPRWMLIHHVLPLQVHHYTFHSTW